MLPGYRTILYASDLSPNAAHAFRHAAALARSFDARICILHVLPEVESAVLNYVATVMGEDRLADLELGHKDDVRTEIEARIEAFAREELGDHPEDKARIDEIRVRHGNPVARILTEADEINADLIVLGSHGKGRLHYTFLGSVAEKVLHRAKRPVLVVPLD
ncbi:Nucleotide-binding universal stress protein, UspA family [Geoalkalibacter ferrihydriticus]|uniref:UspA n=2 Tax=Geoalkalibacter ferrihydriticus TaxID=392333 RepID=A0A0C2HG99_9BACT|nr:universal stress protein [Geoalkalibacter ferrihydriticus]KIH75961.1 UspA [Geoalkalibacter ferrihydriticus DSM 17813]SDM57134.1 Nucleotide-binding universal stress protein, UspA family [Geoalkalibacter ferrihydriticus]